MPRKEACLCEDVDMYSVDCCDEDSIHNQGIGDVYTSPIKPLPPPSETDIIIQFTGENIVTFSGDRTKQFD